MDFKSSFACFFNKIFYKRREEGGGCVNKSRGAAYTNGMEIFVSEKAKNARYIAYIYASLCGMSSACGTKSRIAFDDDRIMLCLETEKKYEPFLRRLAEEKISECIAVGYKYELFRRAVRPTGLCGEDAEILLAALVAADFADDRRYIRSALHGADVYTIDGFFSFRLAAMRRKWQNVTACVPPHFTKEKLAAFLGYLFREGSEKIFVRGGEVYDGQYRKLRRATLIEEGVSEMNGIREIILSGAGEVECVSAPFPKEEEFLRLYYAGKVTFA